jgi:Secretion system C-terminal sorting domain
MKKFLFALFTTATLFGQVSRPTGINLTSITDYSTELVFTDAFKQSRKWIAFNADNSGAFDTNVAIPLSTNGYPLAIPYNNGVNLPQSVRTPMIWDLGANTPVGQYRLIVTGNGQVRLTGGATGTYTCPVDTYVNVTSAVMLEIVSSSAGSPINDIKFIYPQYVNTYNQKIFTDEFLSFANNFQVLRFMDWTRTNFSPVVNWSDRTPANYYTMAKETGASWETVINLSNTLNKDLWINIPHKASDAYISSLANLLQTNLNPSLKVYVEFSNEVWNGAFAQHADCATMAANLGYTGQQWERAWKYTAKRSADVFKIFENVFTNDARLVKTIPSQASNSWLASELLSFFNNPIYNPQGVTANAIAIAPYFAGNVADEIANSGFSNTITVSEIVQRMQQSLQESFNWIAQNKSVASNNNLRLICYEAGQHLVATGNNVNNTVLTNKLIQANKHSNLQTVYCDYLNNWYTNANDLFCHYSSHETYSKWGSWGIKENMNDNLNPKYQALQNCAFNFNTLSINDELLEKVHVTAYPNPFSDAIYIDAYFTKEDINVYNLIGQLIEFKFENSTANQTKILIKNKGTYILKIKNQSSKIIKI